jgi:hypothetical protein
MRESDQDTEIDLGFWLEKTVKKSFSWSEIEEGGENGKVLGSMRDGKWGRFLFLLDRWRKEGSVRDAKLLNLGWTEGKMEECIAPLGCFWL